MPGDQARDRRLAGPGVAEEHEVPGQRRRGQPGLGAQALDAQELRLLPDLGLHAAQADERVELGEELLEGLGGLLGSGSSGTNVVPRAAGVAPWTGTRPGSPASGSGGRASADRSNVDGSTRGRSNADGGSAAASRPAVHRGALHRGGGRGARDDVDRGRPEVARGGHHVGERRRVRLGVRGADEPGQQVGRRRPPAARAGRRREERPERRVGRADGREPAGGRPGDRLGDGGREACALVADGGARRARRRRRRVARASRRVGRGVMGCSTCGVSRPASGASARDEPPNFSARNAPCATRASASSRETASEILSSVTPEQVELVAQHHQRRLALRHHAAVGEVARQPQVPADGLGQVAGRRRDDGVRLLAAGAEPVEARRHVVDGPGDPQHARGHRGGHLAGDLLLDLVRGRQDLGRRRCRGRRGHLGLLTPPQQACEPAHAVTPTRACAHAAAQLVPRSSEPLATSVVSARLTRSR